MPRLLLIACCTLFIVGCGAERSQAQRPTWDSGGVLSPEQAAFDVTHYALDLAINPADSSLAGTVTTVARIVSPTSWFVLDLDQTFTVDDVRDGAGEALRFVHRDGQVWVTFSETKQPGAEVTVAVAYGGQPRVAPNPPWEGGFTWARTPSGAPWIATTCQTNGADLWWPNKDHVSDKADSVAIHIRVPEPLVVATNGHLRRTEAHSDGTRTYHWFVSTPISNYNVALNIAPYELLKTRYTSTSGDVVPVEFYVLPEDAAKGEAFLPEILDHVRFFEEVVGPYPFRADKYGVAQTPHLGMEHQSIIAYGANFDNGAMTGGKDWGFDALHHHELAHEWWGNLVTNQDWRDMWIHEGFGTYMQPLYVERTQGRDGYHAYMNRMRGGIRNAQPMAPQEITSSKEVYGGDIYSKGAWVLHTLRHLIGDDAFFEGLRRMAYPTPADEQVTDGTHVRFATSVDVRTTFERAAGQDLGWFFDLYLPQPDLPILRTERDGPRLTLRWETPGDLPFPMPVDVQIGTELRRIAMPGGTATLTIDEAAEVVVDPMQWILKE